MLLNNRITVNSVKKKKVTYKRKTELPSELSSGRNGNRLRFISVGLVNWYRCSCWRFCTRICWWWLDPSHHPNRFSFMTHRQLGLHNHKIWSVAFFCLFNNDQCFTTKREFLNRYRIKKSVDKGRPLNLKFVSFQFLCLFCSFYILSWFGFKFEWVERFK